MSEFDFPKNWTIRVSDATKHNKAKHITLENKTRPQVMQWISEQGLVSYKLESE